jgi:cell filamentation protein
MTENTDPYLYPGTDVLKTLRGFRDNKLLAEFEAEATARRLLRLNAMPTKGDFNTAHLKAIHQSIFQDVYSWAGKFRTVNISKGGHSFARADFVEPALDDMFRKLAVEKHLTGRDGPTFVKRSAFFLGEINAAHPFREGNGRTQREFIRQLTHAAGFTLHWRRITRDQMIAASRDSFITGNINGLIEIIQLCLLP